MILIFEDKKIIYSFICVLCFLNVANMVWLIKFKPKNDRCDTFYLLFFFYIMHRMSPLPLVFFGNWNIQNYLLHTFCFLYSIIVAFLLSPLLSSLWTGLRTIFLQSIILCMSSILKQKMTNFDVQYCSLYFIQVFNFCPTSSKHIGFLEQYMRGIGY